MFVRRCFCRSWHSPSSFLLLLCNERGFVRRCFLSQNALPSLFSFFSAWVGGKKKMENADACLEGSGPDLFFCPLLKKRGEGIARALTSFSPEFVRSKDASCILTVTRLSPRNHRYPVLQERFMISWGRSSSGSDGPTVTDFRLRHRHCYPQVLTVEDRLGLHALLSSCRRGGFIKNLSVYYSDHVGSTRGTLRR